MSCLVYRLLHVTLGATLFSVPDGCLCGRLASRSCFVRTGRAIWGSGPGPSSARTGRAIRGGQLGRRADPPVPAFASSADAGGPMPVGAWRRAAAPPSSSSSGPNRARYASLPTRAAENDVGAFFNLTVVVSPRARGALNPRSFRGGIDQVSPLRVRAWGRWTARPFRGHQTQLCTAGTYVIAPISNVM